MTQENLSSGFPTWSNINWAVQSQKMARDWKFWIYKLEELYYPCSINKEANQLRGYHKPKDIYALDVRSP